MKKCPQCQGANEPDAMLCKFCGLPLRPQAEGVESSVKQEVVLQGSSATSQPGYKPEIQKGAVSLKPKETKKKKKRPIVVILVVIFLLIFSVIIILNFRPEITNNKFFKVLEEKIAPLLKPFKKNSLPGRPRPTAVRPIKCKIDGIIYSKINPSVIIGGETYGLNDFACGGKIIGIFSNGLVVKFNGRERNYRVGDLLE